MNVFMWKILNQMLTIKYQKIQNKTLVRFVGKYRPLIEEAYKYTKLS